MATRFGCFLSQGRGAREERSFERQCRKNMVQLLCQPAHDMSNTWTQGYPCPQAAANHHWWRPAHATTLCKGEKLGAKPHSPDFWA